MVERNGLRLSGLKNPSTFHKINDFLSNPFFSGGGQFPLRPPEGKPIETPKATVALTVQ